MSFSGSELMQRNEQIVGCIAELKVQRNELHYLIERQQEEKTKLQAEGQRISYKLSLLNRSLAQRTTMATNYDKAIQQAEENYLKLVETSGLLLSSVKREVGNLEQIMDKKTGTENTVKPQERLNSIQPKKMPESTPSPAEISLEALDFEIV